MSDYIKNQCACGCNTTRKICIVGERLTDYQYHYDHQEWLCQCDSCKIVFTKFVMG